MKIEQQPVGAITMVKPVGPVTETDGDSLRERLLELREKKLGRVVLDVSAVPFIDGCGLAALLDVAEAMATTGQVLRICGETEILREILMLTGLYDSFEHFADANSAVRSFL